MHAKSLQSCPTLCKPMDYSPPGSSVHGDSPDKKSGWGLPNPGIEPTSPALQVDSLPSEPTRKSKNTRVGSLSLLHGIFPNQESKLGLLHCRQILYQLNYQRSSEVCNLVNKVNIDVLLILINNINIQLIKCT